MGDILKILDTGTYVDTEKEVSETNQQQIEYYKNTLPSNVKKMSATEQAAWKQSVKDLLNEVLEIMRANRTEINKRVDYLEESETILKEQIQTFEGDDTIKELQEKGINSTIMNIANVQYSDAYSDMLEYYYRLGIVSYKKLFFKAELREIDIDIEQVQNYMDSLE